MLCVLEYNVLQCYKNEPCYMMMFFECIMLEEGSPDNTIFGFQVHQDLWVPNLQ